MTIMQNYIIKNEKLYPNSILNLILNMFSNLHATHPLQILINHALVDFGKLSSLTELAAIERLNKGRPEIHTSIYKEDTYVR